MKYSNLVKHQKVIVKNSQKELIKSYHELSTHLNRLYPEAIEKTRYERELRKQIAKHCNMKVLTSFWIGKYNCDLFFPYLTSEGSSNYSQIKNVDLFRGVVIEVDGCIHHKEFKMRKDNSKYSVLHRLGIGVISLSNDDVITKNETYQEVMRGLVRLRKLDFRAKQRLMRDIYLTSLFSHKTMIYEKELHVSRKLMKLLDQRW
jgi:hypothetical protein